MSETTPLLSSSQQQENAVATTTSVDKRQALFQFLEAQTPAGRWYERFMIVLIVMNVVAFCVGSLFVVEYNPVDWADPVTGLCQTLCDTLWFGNHSNYLSGLGWGNTSVLELVTVLVFSIEYLLRLILLADLEDVRYQGWKGRLRYLVSFFSLVDLASTLPFYIDSFLVKGNLATSAFLRMFRLLRMMKVEGRYDTALTMLDDVLQAQKGILGTALFVGMTTWIAVASLYYLVERKSLDLVYCPNCDNVDTSTCTMDEWGMVSCPDCPNDGDNEACYNLYQSIPLASYYALLNLFGEFPLMDAHSTAGKIVGTFTAVVAVGVFALPAGIIGNGFESMIEQRVSNEETTVAVEEYAITPGHRAQDESTWRGWLYNFLHAQVLPYSTAFDYFINTLVVATVLMFMLDTLDLSSTWANAYMDILEWIAVLVFTLEYILRVFSVKEDPKYKDQRLGRLWYMLSFLAIVDLLSVLPFWLSGNPDSPYVKALRLLRILRFERYTHAFRSFDDVVKQSLDVLSITAFTAILCWVFFAAFLYFSERDNPDEEMAANYNTVPNAMWVTLLNLTGESPLCQYSIWGKVVTGILGLFATGVFGIPIGLLGAGFEQVVEEQADEDNEGETLPTSAVDSSETDVVGSSLEQACYNFVNGIGSTSAMVFETCIYGLIFLAVAVGVWQTVEGHEDDFRNVEAVAVIVFTVEYAIRFIGAGADPEFAKPGRNGFSARLMFVISFYSIVDLLAIVPYYLTVATPRSVLNEWDEYLRMVRILRLLKLDKYVPSITLIDDVIRLKAKSLTVAFFAATTLWIIFAAAMYMIETSDASNEIDPVPQYGCYENCTMEDRFQNFFDSMVYTGIHLTGDYPIITYSWWARVVNFFMVIAAVGVVSIPSGVVASGFVEIVQSKNKARRGEIPVGGNVGDDWYEIRYRELEGQEPPPSRFGPKVDAWQNAVNEFLNGKENDQGKTEWTLSSRATRIFIFLVIVLNIVAVLLESMPAIDRKVGNAPGNFFDAFETFSVMVFAAEYIGRLFCAPKNREALFSTFVYATTFFGIVDFLSTAPWFVEQGLMLTDHLDRDSDNAKIFRIFRMFRILQLEDFVVAFSKLDNVFRASKDVLKATGLMALIIWVGCGALFFIFEENNPNWRECDPSIPAHSPDFKGCYDFATTAACNEVYPDMCSQKAFTNMPDALYAVAVFLGGEWAVVDFTWPGRIVCLFLCVAGIGLYAIPIGTLFDSFGAVLGMGGDDDDEEEENGGDGDEEG